MTQRIKSSLNTYQGKDRIYRKHGTIHGLSKMYLWNATAGEYQMPESGSPWIARKNITNSLGVASRQQKTFATFETARSWLQENIWQANGPPTPTVGSAFVPFASSGFGKNFENIVTDFRKRRYPKLAQGTTSHYDQLLRLHFVPLMKLPVRDITPKVVNEWIDSLIDNVHSYPQARLRKSFEKELTLLGVILRFYDDNEDDPDFRFPIKGRHRRAVQLRKDTKIEDRDLSLEEFGIVHKAFDQLNCKHAVLIKSLFVFQFRQALRVSEAAAVHWEDLKLDFKCPPNSAVRICRHVEWCRTSGIESKITLGFKNSKGVGGFKDQPIFPESFQALKSVHYVGAKGLVFQDENGGFLSYRSIQMVYKRAFGIAGVEYKGTHQLRHGGCRLVYNQTGDLAVASQILGNQDAETIRVYAKRDRQALNEVARKEWAAVTSTNDGEEKTYSL